jgi:tryptophan-rich sensory protein
MKKLRKTPLPPSQFLIVGVWITGVAAIGGTLTMIFIAIEQVRAGHGLDTYRTHWLVNDNWIGFLVFVAATVAALIIGGFLRFKEKHEIQRMEAKYSREQREQQIT